MWALSDADVEVSRRSIFHKVACWIPPILGSFFTWGPPNFRIRSGVVSMSYNFISFFFFIVQVAIPVVPTVRVVITFTKFVELPSTEQFYTPLSSPRHLSKPQSEEDQKPDTNYTFPSWLKRSGSQSASKLLRSATVAQQYFDKDPFVIPSGYTWTSIEDKASNSTSSSKLRKSKSVRKPSK